MGMFNFGRDRGKELRTPIRQGSEQTSAAEMADKLRDLGITIEGGRITVKGDEVTITGKASDTAEKERAVLVLGNTKGVAKVNDQMTVAAQAQAQPQSQFYEVKSGDTLSKIAKQFYGDANKYSAIFEANKPMLKDPDEIYPGQTLRIPQQH
ncbi:MAG TPA: peptidoglycan-binding protein LysM [Vitreimonas sp.]|jgi:nucleoid-associated protein YgaU|nr:peptidoglycan-binding protein LysM [Vitreimonas sp.]